MKLQSLVAGALVTLSLSTAGCASMHELEGLLATIPEISVGEDGLVRVVRKPSPAPVQTPSPDLPLEISPVSTDDEAVSPAPTVTDATPETVIDPRPVRKR